MSFPHKRQTLPNKFDNHRHWANFLVLSHDILESDLDGLSQRSPKHSGKDTTPSKVGETMDKFRQQLQATLESSHSFGVEEQSPLATMQSSQSTYGIKIVTNVKKGIVSHPIDDNWHQEGSSHGDRDTDTFSDDDSFSSTNR
jgi:REP element-mobilizing transposase RayT